MSLVAERSAGVAPAAVAALAKGCLRMMTMAKLKTASILLLVGLAALGLAEAARIQALRRSIRSAAAQPAPPAKAARPAGKGRARTVAGRRRGERAGRRPPRRGGGRRGRPAARWRDSSRSTPTRVRGKGPFAIASPRDRPGRPPPSRPTARGDSRCDGRGPRPTGSPWSASSMLLWEVTRKEVPDANDVAITLPEPGDIDDPRRDPGEAGEAGILDRRPAADRVDWESDSVFYRQIEVPNPGERVVRPLPPAQYAVERINFTPQGARATAT